MTVLCVREDSIYHGMPAVDAYDADRDMRTWEGGTTVVAHPPCGQWGRLRRFANVNADEKALAPIAVEHVRKFGGVLEHPAWSTLWTECGMPLPGKGQDEFGGWTLSVQQFWWGHKAAKPTWLYIVGCRAQDIPQIPIELGSPKYEITGSWASGKKPLPKADRERTPILFAEWLIELARECAH